ncbi:PREDICTED: chymotrypsin BII-like [Ceratosolen solmsi marchali]|uniref:Chymotrypsin BII-like n=1 Tax=Ceratosolen solmsi marchali TaxID=326594 RepID=A0AAJ7DY34_9HYME|nr:PREDICTED: chymotrypsin BII-like [Ceratosolen solmsi marchali]
MRLQIILLFGFYRLLCMWCNFATVEALIGENVRLAGESEFPFIVAIMRYVLENNMRRNYICAGTLISRKDILTAEHCLTAQHLTGIYVLAGSSNIDQTYKYYPEWWITYDQWANSNNHVIEMTDNDIGILNLLQRVPDQIVPAHVWNNPLELVYGWQAQIAGWGLSRNFFIFEFTSTTPMIGHSIRQAMTNEFPFVAGIIQRMPEVEGRSAIMCTGVAFTKNYVLTAAHCVKGKAFKDIEMIIGSIDISSRIKYFAAWWLTFDEWNQLRNIHRGFPKNDINLIRLTDAIPDVIPLASILYVSNKNVIGANVISVGWGQLSNGSYPKILQIIDLKILPTDICENKISALHGERLYVDKNILCTNNDPFALLMHGDSGGPLIYNNAVIGINLGTCPLPQDLFNPDKVNLHTNILYYRQYLTDVVNNY